MTTPDPADRRRTSVTIIALAAGVMLGLVLLLIVFLVFDDDGEPPATTVAAVTSTAAPTTRATTTAAPTTTAAATTAATTTRATTTTTFGTTDGKEGEVEGEPGGHLTDVRIGGHEGFTRVVFEFDGTGIPAYRVEYADPPFATGGEGAEVPVDGAVFIQVLVSPARTFDIEDPDFAPTYTGPDRLDPGLGAITEIVFVDDFEASMVWVIGLSAERGFTVDTLTDPVRLVIDIGD